MTPEMMDTPDGTFPASGEKLPVDDADATDTVQHQTVCHGWDQPPAGRDPEVGSDTFSDLGFAPEEVAEWLASSRRISAKLRAVEGKMMAQVMDDLDGNCLQCGGKQVLIDTDGADTPEFWAYCDSCNHTSCFGQTPDAVLRQWQAAQAAAREGG